LIDKAAAGGVKKYRVLSHNKGARHLSASITNKILVPTNI
jgi:hypothetical protein